MKRSKLILCFALVSMLLACDKDGEVVVTRIEVSKTTIEAHRTTARVVCTMLCNNEDPQVCYSLTSDFKEEKYASLTKGNQGKTYSAVLENLQPEAKYYVRYRIMNGVSSYYYDKHVDTFSTLQESTPLVLTTGVSEITPYSCLCSGRIVESGGKDLEECGFCYKSMEANPTINDSKLSYNTGERGLQEEPFSCQLSLYPKTTYYVRAYCINSVGVSYGDEFMVTTPRGDLRDLGLSVEWGAYNIGAKTSEEYGEFFAWAEIESKSSYKQYYWDYYKYCNGEASSLTKYCTWGSVNDGKRKLEAEDDVATVRLGTGWRMPTKDEWQELIDSCSWTWTTTANGVKGYRITSKKPGNVNYIFLPAAGGMQYFGRYSAGEGGFYWSSELSNGNDMAYQLEFKGWSPQLTTEARYAGLSVRAIHEKNK